MKKFFSKLKGVGIKDIFHILLFLIAYPISLVYKAKRKNMWLCCEYENEARDNGYWFYKYVREKHPEQDVVYAINKKSKDYEKVKNLGETVSYGTIKHWVYYLSASVNISSQKGGKPNSAVCYLLEVYGLLNNKRVFLQHGITKDKAEVFFFENTKMRLFICGAKPEYDFVKENFHYPPENVVYTGFSRFDYLLEPFPQKKQILVAPTWRQWLRSASSDPYKKGSNKHITTSEYFKTWEGFLKSEELASLCEEYGYSLVFFPHRNVANSFDAVKTLSDKIIVTNWEKDDLQILMKESAIMITDYTSAVMDFAYMEKPVIYYQFDFQKYREEHFAEGYYNYERDGFGKVTYDLKSLLAQTEKLMIECKCQEEYLQRINSFFAIRDMNNCERIFEQVKKL